MMLETGFTGLFELFRAFTGFYLVLPSFIMLDIDFTMLHRVPKKFLLGFLWPEMGFKCCLKVVPGCT